MLDDLTTSKEERLAAELKVKELISNYEVEMERNVTERWVSDNKSDSWMTKSIRPYGLAFMFVATILMVFVDAGSIDFEVDSEWKSLLTTVLMTMVAAFYGGRTFEKIKKYN